MSTLAATGLRKSFKGRPIVQKVDFRLETGEVVGLLGPNGAGKTTSFYLTLGLISADSGQVSIDNTDVSDMPMHMRALSGIGYLPQEPSVFRKMTVADNILSILETNPRLSRVDRETRLNQLLEEFHIKELADNLGISLSGGERRRVEIARALASEPKFLLLDEPFAGVDPISILDIKQHIRHLRERGIGILITDHNVRDTLEICQRAYIVSNGRILAEGSPNDLVNNQAVRDAYLGEQFAL